MLEMVIVFPETLVVILHLKFAVIHVGVFVPKVGVVQTAARQSALAFVITVVELPSKVWQLAELVDVDVDDDVEAVLLLANASNAKVLVVSSDFFGLHALQIMAAEIEINRKLFFIGLPHLYFLVWKEDSID